jgi:hypothetical protein
VKSALTLKNLIAPFFLCWTVSTVLFFYFPIPSETSLFQRNLILFLFIGLYLLLASCLTYRTIKVVLSESSAEISKYCAVVALLFLLLYGSARIYDQSTVVIAGLATANLLFGASIAGTLLSSAVKRTAELVPVCLTAATADVMSVVKGPTRGMIEDISSYYEEGMEGAPPFVDFIVVKAGIPGFDIPVPLFGVTDWILVSLLSASLLRLKKSDNIMPGNGVLAKYFFFPISALALYSGLIVAQITELFLPAMVFISFFFLLYLSIKMKVHRELKKSDIVYSFILPSCVVVVILIVSR